MNYKDKCALCGFKESAAIEHTDVFKTSSQGSSDNEGKRQDNLRDFSHQFSLLGLHGLCSDNTNKDHLQTICDKDINTGKLHNLHFHLIVCVLVSVRTRIFQA